jgi:glycosyltransferase involved in cell wall biosynthesis
MADVLYVVADKLGGIASFTANLIRYRPASALPQRILLFRKREESDSPISENVDADSTIYFKYSAAENLYAVLRRLGAIMPRSPGALISNDSLELALHSWHRPARTIFHIVHDEYNFGLVRTYAAIIDVMVAHSRFYYEKLMKEFPARADQIFHLPYGVRLSPTRRQSMKGPLRLIFLGRLTKGKGVHDLPVIDRYLRNAGASVRWTVIGNGPERETLHATWPETERVRYFSPATNREVLELCVDGDVFVLPTRFEGFPVALLEAMSAGLVPVVSDLPSGIPEVVNNDSGFRVPVGDCQAFATAILQLAKNRDTLERMSKATRKQAERFDIRDRALSYHNLFADWQRFKRPWPGPLRLKHGSRLDQPWLPNMATRSLRSLASFAER